MKSIDNFIIEKLHLKQGTKRSLDKSCFFLDRSGGFHVLTLYDRDMTDDEFKQYLTKEWGPLNDIRIKKDSIKIFDTKEEANQYRQKMCDEKYGKLR